MEGPARGLHSSESTGVAALSLPFRLGGAVLVADFFAVGVFFGVGVFLTATGTSSISISGSRCGGIFRFWERLDDATDGTFDAANLRIGVRTCWDSSTVAAACCFPGSIRGFLEETWTST